MFISQCYERSLHHVTCSEEHQKNIGAMANLVDFVAGLTFLIIGILGVSGLSFTAQWAFLGVGVVYTAANLLSLYMSGGGFCKQFLAD